MESQPQNSEFKNNLENFHPCICVKKYFQLPCRVRTLVRLSLYTGSSEPLLIIFFISTKSSCAGLAIYTLKPKKIRNNNKNLLYLTALLN